MDTRNPISIILIEDDSNDAALIRQILKGYSQEIIDVQVDTEESLLGALARRTWDIVLCDNAVPRLTLDVVLGILKEFAPGLPIVLVAGTVGEEAVADIMRRGVADVVHKDRLAPRLVPILTREIDQVRRRRAADARMQRIAAVLGFFSDAADWRAAMELSLAHIGQTCGAGFAAMYELTADGQILEPIAEWADGSASRLLAALLTANPPPAGNSLTGMSLLRKEPMVTRLADVTDLAQFPLARAAASFGMVSLVSQPLPVGGRIFGISLTFPAERDDLANVQFELNAISDALRPVLFRKISDNERALLLDALNATGSGVFITEAAPTEDPGPRIVYVNQAACRMSGYDQSALLGNTPLILQGPRTDSDQWAKIRRAFTAREPASVELEIYREDGTPFWVSVDMTPVRDGNRVTHYIAIQTDITVRRVAEEERTQREASFRMLFENNPMPMWVYDAETLAFLEVNAAASSHYGWPRAAFLQRRVSDIVSIDDQAAPVRTGAGSEGGDSTIGAAHITASGERITVRVATHCITYHGRAAMLAAVWDVTEIERGRRELSRVNDELARTTEALKVRTTDLLDAARLAHIGTWSLTFEPRTVIWSPETYAIFGQDPATFVATPANVLACVHVDDQAIFSAADRQLGQIRETAEMEYRIVRPTGETRVLRELARPKFDGAGTMIGVAGLIQDITEQKNAEQALLRAEKLKTIGQITGGIAHDFNNLLTVVGLNLEAALDEEDLPGRVRSTLEPALHATHRGGELTAQLLSYARRPSLKPRVVSLSELIQTLQPLLLRAVGERHSLKITPPPGEMRLEIDPGQFENALMNIVINARDAMIEDGAVDVSFTLASLTAPLGAFPDVVPAGDYIRVRVADTGDGIDPVILPKIFEPFFTTKAPGTGTGLGLSMVYGFVQQSCGHMTITSTQGAGTTIDLYLPMAKTAPTALPAAPIRGDFSRQKRSVLLVEDGDALRRALHHMFTELGLDAMSVATAAEAREALGSPRPFDILFSDITLPGGVNGVTLATEAEMMRPGIAVVLTTGNAQQIDPIMCARWNLLVKPFRSSAVAALLNTIISDDRHIAPIRNDLLQTVIA